MDEVTAPAKTDEPERSWWCTARRWKTADTWCARRRLTATVRAENADRRHARGRIEADAQGPPWARRLRNIILLGARPSASFASMVTPPSKD